MTNYTPNSWASGDPITEVKMDRLEAGVANHTHAAADVASGTVAPARLGSGGTGGTTRFLREDSTFAVPPGGGGSGYATVAEEGSALTARATVNFIGRAVTAVDNSGSSRTDVTVQDTALVHAVGNSGTSLTLDAASVLGPVKTITLTGNCVFTFSAVTSGREYWMVLVLTEDGTGSRLVTWPGSAKWSPGAAPTLSTTPGAVDRILVTTYNGGTTWFCDVIGKNYA